MKALSSRGLFRPVPGRPYCYLLWSNKAANTDVLSLDCRRWPDGYIQILERTQAYRDYVALGRTDVHKSMDRALREVEDFLVFDRQRQCDCGVCQRQKSKRDVEEEEIKRERKRNKAERLRMG